MSELVTAPGTMFTRRDLFKTIAAVAAVGCAGSAATAPVADPKPKAATDEARRLKVAGLVIRRRGSDCEGNLQELEELAAIAAGRGAKLLVTPEGFLEGYIVGTKGLTRERYAELAQAIPGGPHFERICAIARKHAVFLAAGMAEKDGERFYNACALIDPEGNLIGKYRKVHNLNDEPLNERGDSFPVSNTLVGRVGIMICYDRQPPETARLLALGGADIILCPAAGIHGETNTIMMRTRAYENGLPIVFAHNADCLIIDREGKLVANYVEGGDRVVAAEVKIGRSGSTIDHRRPELYGGLCK